MKPTRIRTTSYHLLQITPAQPGTFVLFRVPGEKRLSRHPVPAWGMWDETAEYRDANGRVVHRDPPVRGAGPLIPIYGQLVPADAEEEFVGIRIGAFVEIDDGWRWDPHSEGEELDVSPPPSPKSPAVAEVRSLERVPEAFATTTACAESGHCGATHTCSRRVDPGLPCGAEVCDACEGHHETQHETWDRMGRVDDTDGEPR